MRFTSCTTLATSLSTSLATTLLIATFAAPSRAQTAGTDNRDGSYVNFEESPVHPVELLAEHDELWVANVAAGTVSVFKASALLLLDEIQVGMGPVTVRRRPKSEELWVTCASSGAIFVLDRGSRSVLDSFMPGQATLTTSGAFEIPVEPSGLVFDIAGDKAYCTLSLVNQVVEIDAAQRAVVRRLEFGTKFPNPLNSPLVHAEEPRALLLDGNQLFVLAFESGNGTTANAKLLSSTMVDMWDLTLNPPPGTGPFPPPPDRDLLAFDLASGATDATIALWRMGTLCFDVKKVPARGAARFVVSNVDANNMLEGEHQFPQGGIARHRLTIATTGSAVIPQATTVIDLNDPASRHPLLPLSKALFAVPNEIALTANGQLLFCCCYDTRNTAVVDLASGTVIASLAASGFGPRGLALDEASERLWVFNRADATLDQFDLTQVAAGAVITPLASLPVGFDPTPAVIRNGRLVHIDASNSGTGTQSCNTCHLDGHADRIAWSLGEFTGTLTDALKVDKDDKKVKVTQSLRGLEETAPFHWRGDRVDLDAFKPAFIGLLGGAEPSVVEFRNFQSYVFSLAMPANPGQLPTRELSTASGADATKGRAAFLQLPVTRVALDTAPPFTDRRLACADCHNLTGFNGATNQIFNDVTLPVVADNPAHLRGLFDKDSDDVNYRAMTFNSVNLNGLDRTPATGFGMANNGFADGLKHFVIENFTASDSAKQAITAFVAEFDSGTAAAAMWSYTLTPAKSGLPAATPVATFLQPQATAGNCDLAVHAFLPGSPRPRIGFRFDPASQLFEPDSVTLAPQSLAQLDALAQLGGVLVFLGVPVGTGGRVGIDRDGDFLRDGDEIITSPTDSDSDDDSYPDGYETDHGSNPADNASWPSNGVAPTITAAQLVFENSVLAKFRWTTSSEATSRIRLRDPATGALIATFSERRFERQHVMVVRKLKPGTQYLAEIDGTDANGNVATISSITFQAGAHVFQSVHSDVVVLASQGTLPSNKEDLLATFTVRGEDGALIDGATVTGRFIEWIDGQAASETRFMTAAPSVGGVATAAYVTLNDDGSLAFVEVVVDSISTTANELHFHPHETDFSDKVQL
ncbi:MAG: hypothetical protein EXS13_06120 [Planctomycetes bacterium]|nr:hypothetical protein [Planctomycetota bacterium]